MSYKKTKEVVIIKKAMSGGEFTRTVWKKGNKKYVKMWNRYVPLSRVRVVGRARRKK